MRGFLRFFSLSVANQFCALLYQIVLLPLQLRIWGHEVAAHWFVLIAAANFMSVSDFGLRNAGHLPLLASVRTNDPAAGDEFRQTWALTRLLMFAATVVFMSYQLLTDTEPAVLIATVIGSLAIDMVIVVRGVWYDTLGYFTRVEVGFFAFVSVRLALSIFAIVVFHAPPEMLGWIMLVTAIGGLATQTYLFPIPRSLWLSAGGFRDLHWSSLAVIRFVVADPLITWMRMNLPVIVVATIASSEVVATYVALRAVFGLARQIIGQLNRYGSVQYVRRVDSDASMADQIVIRVILACTVITVAVASVVTADHGRILQLWLGLKVDHEFAIVLMFAVGTVLYPYQVVSSVLMRSGDVAGVAKRQYCYILVGGIAALVTCVFNIDLVIYLGLLAFQEFFIATLFIGSLGRHIMRAAIAAFSIATVTLGLLVSVVYLDKALFTSTAPISMVLSFAIAGLPVAVALIASLVVDYAGTPKMKVAAYVSLDD